MTRRAARPCPPLLLQLVIERLDDVIADDGLTIDGLWFEARA
jgi:hypothetical protein